MLGNDAAGDCVCAAAGHIVQDDTSEESVECVPADAEALNLYSILTGYNPADPSTDVGTDPIAALNYWRQTGVTFGGQVHMLGAYALVDPTNTPLVCAAINIFGPLLNCVSLPRSVTGPLDQGTIVEWSMPGGLLGMLPQYQPDPSAGHAVPIPAYSQTVGRGRNKNASTAGFTVQTWAQSVPMDAAFLAKCGTQLFALISMDWVSGAKPCPSGFGLADLQSDLAKLSA
jgi:hypothetical protein